jgi:hypothetical protein
MKAWMLVMVAMPLTFTGCGDPTGACATPVNCLNTTKSKCLSSQTFTAGKACKDVGFPNDANGIWRK